MTNYKTFRMSTQVSTLPFWVLTLGLTSPFRGAGVNPQKWWVDVRVDIPKPASTLRFYPMSTLSTLF